MAARLVGMDTWGRPISNTQHGKSSQALSIGISPIKLAAAAGQAGSGRPQQGVSPARRVHGTAAGSSRAPRGGYQY
jgi:hypothetical protein